MLVHYEDQQRQQYTTGLYYNACAAPVAREVQSRIQRLILRALSMPHFRQHTADNSDRQPWIVHQSRIFGARLQEAMQHQEVQAQHCFVHAHATISRAGDCRSAL